MRTTATSLVMLALFALSGCGGSSDTTNVNAAADAPLTDDDASMSEPVVPDAGTATEDLTTPPGDDVDATPDETTTPGDAEPSPPTPDDTGEGTTVDPPSTDETGDIEPPQSGGASAGTTDASTPTNAASGNPTDCGLTLPCLWISDDGGLEVLLTYAHGENLDGSGRLLTMFSVTATRDIEATLQSSSQTLADGVAQEAQSVTLGSDSPLFGRAATADLQVGLRVIGSVSYGEALGTTVSRIDQVRIDLLDGDNARAATFENVPHGRAPSAISDCASSVPCEWISPDGVVTMNLTRVERVQRTTVVSFTLRANEPVQVGAGNRSMALSNQAVSYATSRVALAGEGPIVSNASFTAGTTIGPEGATPGTVTFLNLAGPLETEFERLQITLWNARALRVPRWNPVFTNVPIAE